MTPQALIDALAQPWEHGEHVDARGAGFDAPVVLDERELRSFDLSNASFDVGLSARNARFRGMAWLRRASVTGTLDLRGASFRTDLRLDGLHCDTVILDNALFEGVLSLDRARIGTLQARNCLCLANLSMAGAIVTHSADLSGSVVMGGLWAEQARLPDANLGGPEIDGRRQGI